MNGGSNIALRVSQLIIDANLDLGATYMLKADKISESTPGNGINAVTGSNLTTLADV